MWQRSSGSGLVRLQGVDQLSPLVRLYTSSNFGAGCLGIDCLYAFPHEHITNLTNTHPITHTWVEWKVKVTEKTEPNRGMKP